MLTIMLPLGLMWAWYVWSAFDESRKDAYTHMDQVVQTVAQHIEQALDDQKRLIETVAAEFAGDTPKRSASFNPDQFARIHADILVLGVQDLQGRAVYTSPGFPLEAAQIMASKWAQRALESDKFEVHGVYSIPGDKRQFAMLTYPVRDTNRRRTGFVYFALDLLELNPRILGWVPRDVVVPVLDQTDHFLFQSVEPEALIGKPLPEINARMVKGMVRQQFEAPDVHGVQRLYSVTTVGKTGWRVFSGVPTEQAFSHAIQLRRSTMVVGSLMGVMILGLAIWRSTQIAKPIVRLTEGVRRLAQDPAARLVTNGPQEVNEVAGSFNALLDQLNHEAQERRALSDHYASLINNARDIILLFDESGRVVDANLAAVATYGYSLKQLRGMTAADLRAPDARAMVGGDWRQAAQTAGVLFETTHMRADHTTFPVEVSSTAIEIDGRTYRQSFVRDITQRHEAQRAHALLAQLAHETLDALDLCVGVLDANGCVLSVNQAWHSYAHQHPTAWMVPPLEAGADFLAALERATAKEAALYAADIRAVVQQSSTALECELSYPDQGHMRWVGVHMTRFSGGTGNSVVVISDQTQRKTMEVSLRRQTRALRAWGGVNHAIVTAADQQSMLETVCQALVENAAYKMAWVGPKRDDADGWVHPVASAGDREGYLGRTRFSWYENRPEGQGPAGQAIRKGEPIVMRDLQNNPAFVPWRAAALQSGFEALVALPLMLHGQTWGVICVYAPEFDAFDADEMALLRELSHNLAYGIDKAQVQQAAQALQARLQASEARFRLLIEQSPAGIFAMRHGVFVYANPRMEEILGYEPDGLEGVRSQDIVVPEDWPILLDGMRTLSATGSSGNLTVRVRRRDGTIVQLGLQDVRTEFNGETALVGMAQDIGERLRAQDEIRRYVHLLEQTTESTLRAVAAMVEHRDPYTAGHQRRVGDLAAAIGEEMGLDAHTVRGLRLTGVVHDIGKIGVPAELLAKPTRLSDVELAMIRQHAQIGFDVLKDVEFPWPVANVILQHHERLDGSGYPNQLAGEAILLEARIMMVADVVESMASHRPYRPSRGLDAALQEVQNFRGTRYDATVVDACVRLFNEKGYQLA